MNSYFVSLLQYKKRECHWIGTTTTFLKFKKRNTILYLEPNLTLTYLTWETLFWFITLNKNRNDILFVSHDLISGQIETVFSGINVSGLILPLGCQVNLLKRYALWSLC
jgi:hypothetical protein